MLGKIKTAIQYIICKMFKLDSIEKFRIDEFEFTDEEIESIENEIRNMR